MHECVLEYVPLYIFMCNFNFKQNTKCQESNEWKVYVALGFKITTLTSSHHCSASFHKAARPLWYRISSLMLPTLISPPPMKTIKRSYIANDTNHIFSWITIMWVHPTFITKLLLDDPRLVNFIHPEASGLSEHQDRLVVRAAVSNHMKLHAKLWW